jgi:hypothetical protein
MADRTSDAGTVREGLAMEQQAVSWGAYYLLREVVQAEVYVPDIEPRIRLMEELIDRRFVLKDATRLRATPEGAGFLKSAVYSAQASRFQSPDVSAQEIPV